MDDEVTHSHQGLIKASFEPIRDFFQRRLVARVNALASGLQLVTLRSDAARGNFVFPGTDFIDDIEVDGIHVGQVDYSINPIRDRLYTNMIEVSGDRQRQGIGSATLWNLWQMQWIPFVPIEQYASSYGFWESVRARLGAAGARIEPELRGDDPLEQQRWQHLVPKFALERRIRTMEASADA